jgi:hypothetical protein
LDIVGLSGRAFYLLCKLNLAFGFDFHGVNEDFNGESQTEKILNDFNTILSEIENRSYQVSGDFGFSSMKLISIPNWFYLRFTSSGKKFNSGFLLKIYL